MTESAIFPMLGPEPCSTTCSYTNDAGERVTERYVTYRMPEQVSRALGKGCVCRTLSVPERALPPVVICIRWSPDGEWIGVADGSYDVIEAERIASLYCERYPY